MRTRLIAPVLMLLPVLSTLGCDDEPACSLDALVTGGYDGAIAWDLAGRTGCGLADPTAVDPNSSALAFVDTSTGITQSIYILPQTPQLVVGVYPAQVLFIVAGNLWESGVGNCEVTITRLNLENWSVVDFYDLEGALVCNNPLASASPDVDDVTITGAVTFSGHMHAEVLSFSGL